MDSAWREDCYTTIERGGGHLLNGLRKLFFWNYARNTWQWDVLCVVILIFIFGAPKSWFENGEPAGVFAHQSPTASIVFVDAEVVENAKDKGELERRVRSLTGRDEARILNVRKVVDKEGKTRGYQVDIR